MKLHRIASVVLCSLLLANPVLADDKFTVEAAKEIEAVKLARDTQAGGYKLLTVGELKSMMDEGKPMVIVDTMPEGSYKKEHIPGARNLVFPVSPMAAWDAGETAGKSEADYLALLGEDKERPVAVYCGFVKCTRSDNGAAWAKKLGYKNVYRVPGGLFAWKGAGLPLEDVK